MNKVTTVAELIGIINSSKEIKDQHDNNNRIIKERLDEFIEANQGLGLSQKDIVVCGSSCASYMDYFVINRVRDIDICLRNNDWDCKELIRTKGIDYIYSNPYRLLDEHEFMEKDGYLFFTKEQLLVTMTISATLKMKFRNMTYIRLLLVDLNKTVEEFIQNVYETLSSTSSIEEGRKETVLTRLNMFKIKFHNNSLEEERKRYLEQQNILN